MNHYAVIDTYDLVLAVLETDIPPAEMYAPVGEGRRWLNELREELHGKAPCWPYQVVTCAAAVRVGDRLERAEIGDLKPGERFEWADEQGRELEGPQTLLRHDGESCWHVPVASPESAPIQSASDWLVRRIP